MAPSVEAGLRNKIIPFHTFTGEVVYIILFNGCLAYLQQQKEREKRLFLSRTLAFSLFLLNELHIFRYFVVFFCCCFPLNKIFCIQPFFFVKHSCFNEEHNSQYQKRIFS